MEDLEREENQQVLRVLQLLKQASHDLQSNPSHKPTESNSSAINALLELQTESDTILSDPHLNQLSQHLSYLKTLVETLERTRGHSLRSFLRRRVSTHQIARVAESIESEIQAWIDREFVESLVKSLRGLESESDKVDSDSLILPCGTRDVSHEDVGSINPQVSGEQESFEVDSSSLILPCGTRDVSIEDVGSISPQVNGEQESFEVDSTTLILPRGTCDVVGSINSQVNGLQESFKVDSAALILPCETRDEDVNGSNPQGFVNNGEGLDSTSLVFPCGTRDVSIEDVNGSSPQGFVTKEEGLESSSLVLPCGTSETELITLLRQFHDRVSQGFNRELQDLVLKNGVFTELETILIDPTRSIKLREECGFVIEGLIRFNKNVFVGQVLMGPTIKALISMSSISSLKVLCSLIKSIKSPLVDEIEANKGIPIIIGLLNSDDLAIKVLGFDCVLEIGYFGRKEAIEAMMEEDIVKKLVELQRSELGGDLIEVTESETEENKGKERKSRESYLEKHPFASCVARFAVQLEVGEGLRQREKRGFKQVILRRVKEASVSDAEAATIQAEVLWGSFS